ncbi:MAG TPA: glycosyltransferase [Gemmataceae bacterium]|nr:glycosyltransferase [Gemmataceae bacterium]
MRLVFVYWAFEDQGSGLVIQGYTEAARALGHEVAVYGRWRCARDNPNIPLNYSLDLASADAVLFVFEWTTDLRPGDHLDLVRLVGAVPRNRRVILDGDGNYNDPLAEGGDYNHRDPAAARQWAEVCDSLTDKVCQPTLHPRRPNVRPFLFYAYNPAWERPADIATREFDVLYVGHSKFRWRPMHRVLQAVEPVRERLGRVGLVGHGWGAPPPWAGEMGIEDYYRTDAVYLNRLGVELMPAVRFTEVIERMGRARVNPVLLRPTFERLRIVTPRMFETPASGTLPLFAFDREHVREIYGEAGLEFWLPDEGGPEKVLDLVHRPDRYRKPLMEVRRHLATRHSHAARLRELIEIVES